MTDIRKELQALRDLGAETVQRTSRLLAELSEPAPVQGKAPSRKKNMSIEERIRTRKRRIPGYTKTKFILILVVASACMIGCAKPLGACYENGFIGYGHTPKAIHGPKRQSY